MGNMEPADFRGLLCSSQLFREYVIEIMDTHAGGVGAYKPEPFNFTLPVGNSETLDMRKYLETTFQQQHGEIISRPGLPACFEDPDVGVISEALARVFPMPMMYVFMIKNRPPITTSDGIEKPTAFAFGFSVAGLSWSVLLYLSLSASSSQTESSGKALQSWLRLGWPMIIMSYALLFCTLVSFLVGFLRNLQWNSPLFAQTYENMSTIATIILFAPLLGLGIVVGIAAWCLSTKTHVALMREVPSEVPS